MSVVVVTCSPSACSIVIVAGISDEMAAMGEVIAARNLVKSYGDLRAVDDVTVAVEAGEVFGILGPNGAAKTTTLEILGGLRPADTPVRRPCSDTRRGRATPHCCAGSASSCRPRASSSG